MKVIGLTGYKRSGKDTAAQIIARSTTHGAIFYAFADPIYRMAAEFLGMDMLEVRCMDKEAIIFPYGVTLRHILQTIGTEWGRELIHPDVWMKKARARLNEVRSWPKPPEYFLITDVRFNNEAEFIIKEAAGCIIQVHRNCAKGDGHKSEKPISRDFVDYQIFNPASERPGAAEEEQFRRIVLQTLADMY